MFVILAYDIHQKRVGKALKVCRKYLMHVQKSVFEGVITEAGLKRLKDELVQLVVPEEDSVCIYRMETVKYMVKEQLGIVQEKSHII